ncbi:SRPBCC family protein [Inquilinus sp.]|uniref:SRPBCC family protein n=1 Tax=Inquilinus sp. TaxID=1932117 RepID=UPI0031DF2EA0
MIRVTTSSVINAPVDTVWQAIRDFNDLPGWHPRIAESRVEDGGPSDRVGCVRAMVLAGGGAIRERLLALSDDEHWVRYAILESPMPVKNYVATLRLLPISDGDRSFAEWSAEFDVPADQEDTMRQTIGQGVFQTGFDSLKQRFGG